MHEESKHVSLTLGYIQTMILIWQEIGLRCIFETSSVTIFVANKTRNILDIAFI